MNTINVEGFTFNHVGDFYINPIKSAKKYTWGEKGDKQCDHLSTCISLFEDFSDETKELVYLVTVDEEVSFVGEFSNSFRDRWLKTDNYIWHHKGHLIDDALIKNRKVSLWFVVDPYLDTLSGVKLNISKSIEHHILKNRSLDWNKRNN
jgi:hypothetical protein